MSKLHKGFQVRQYKPWKMWAGLFLLAMMLTLFFQLGQNYQAYELNHVQLEVETLYSRIDELESRNHRLVQKNAHLQGVSKIERDAYEITNQALVKLQRELLTHQEELAFYQGIVSPQDADLGVNIQSVKINKKGHENYFSYKMILTKNGKSSKKLRGNFSVIIRGQTEGRVSELNLSEIGLDNQRKVTKYSFRYFQIFEGDITLPDGFEPFEVKIGIKSTTKKVKSFSETIAWARILSEGV